MNAYVYPPVMNTNMRTIYKVVVVYTAVQLLILLCLAIVSGVLVYGFGNSGDGFETTNPLFLGLAGITLLFTTLFPPIYAATRYSNFSSDLPNSESRLTLAMLFALVASCFALVIAAPKAGVLIDRLISGNLPVYELLFALTSAAATYMFNFIVALIGIRIGIRLTSKHFK